MQRPCLIIKILGLNFKVVGQPSYLIKVPISVCLPNADKNNHFCIMHALSLNDLW